MPDEKAPSSGAFLLVSLMYFCSGQPMHYCSGVDRYAIMSGLLPVWGNTLVASAYLSARANSTLN
jgi:hypothetical protein